MLESRVIGQLYETVGPPDDPVVSGRGSITTTFLFTDLEGSTELWERAPALMAQALAAHDSLVRDVVEEHGGQVFWYGLLAVLMWPELALWLPGVLRE